MGKRATKATEPQACAKCNEPIHVGDLMVWWGYGRTGARHLRCTTPRTREVSRG